MTALSLIQPVLVVTIHVWPFPPDVFQTFFFFLTTIQSIKCISHNLYKRIHVHGTKVNISVKYTHSLTWSGDSGLPWGNMFLAITKSTKWIN